MSISGEGVLKESSIFHEYKRKVVHLTALLIPILYYFLPQGFTKPALVSFASCFVLLDLLRLRHPKLKLFFWRLFSQFLRQRERRVLNAGSYLLISSVIVVFLLKKEVAVSCLCFAILGDTGAALVGMRFGRHPIGRKSLEGSLACLLLCFLATFLIPSLSMLSRLAGPVAATVMELAPKSLDDNLVVPIVSGGIMEILS